MVYVCRMLVDIFIVIFQIKCIQTTAILCFFKSFVVVYSLTVTKSLVYYVTGELIIRTKLPV